MKKCAFLSTDNLEGFFVNDELAKPALVAQGWVVEDVSWHRQDVDWNQYDVVIIRSTWDYQNHPDRFLHCLEAIEASQAKLMNSLDVVRWNFDKSYLLDLEKQGVEIVPTCIYDHFDAQQLAAAFTHFGVDELVIKPLLSANGDDTYRVAQANLAQQIPQLHARFNQRKLILQPYIASVKSLGEYSLFYFAGDYSHCITKTPQSDEFRCQEEHGGELKKVEPNQALKRAAQKVLTVLPGDILYARLDFLLYQERYVLIEAELIEPSLYFNMDPEAANRFAKALLIQS